MSEYFDAGAAKQRYELLDDASLIRIAFGDSGYAQEAVALARAELSRRGIENHEHPLVTATSHAEQVEAQSKRHSELHGALKALCFLMPGCLSLLIAAWCAASGRPTAAKDALIWTLFGVLAWAALGVVLSVFAAAA